MIHSARPTVSPVAITTWKVGADVWTEISFEKSYHYRPWLWVGLVDQQDTSFLWSTSVHSPAINDFRLIF